MFDHDPNRKGNVAELAIATEAARIGLSVLKPLTEHERYDLVLGIAGRLHRVQCKWAKKAGQTIAINLTSSRRSGSGYVRTKYTAADVDLVGAYCDELCGCYLIPIEDIAGQGTMQLRLAPARNGQRAALHLAEQYELGAVAQLAERCHGMAEAEGSNPSSSTFSLGNPSSQTEIEVGAHEFRNHFGYYMEQATSGAEILIRRRGRPYARLCPAKS